MSLLVRRLGEGERELVKGLRVHPEAERWFSVDWEVAEGESWGLWLEGRLIGWCRMVGRPPILWVSRILIDEPYVGLGYGKLLLGRVLEEVGRSWRWREVRAAVHPENGRALRFFMGLGFEALPYAEQVGEVILWRSLH
jgi:GNAT superfamily N-acetyltransferase